MKVSDVATIIKTVALHRTIVSVKSELDQLAEGLHLFRVLELLKSHPKKCRSLFAHNAWCKITAEQMITLFHTQLSTLGSSRCVIEDDFIQDWNEFLQDVSNGIISKSKLLFSLKIRMIAIFPKRGTDELPLFLASLCLMWSFECGS